MYVLNYSNLSKINNVIGKTKLSGSSRFKHHNPEVTVKKIEPKRFNPSESLSRRYHYSCEFSRYYNFPVSSEFYSECRGFGAEHEKNIRDFEIYKESFYRKSENRNTTYLLNKSKIRKKLTALTRLNKSLKFIAFYSISFPANAPDDVLYTCFNSWLTNCRKRYNLKTYLWVAERQGNGTLHFHLLTNNRMNIQEVNKAMAKSIETQVKKGLMSWGNSSLEKYNGIDVDSPQFPKKRQNDTRETYRRKLNRAKSLKKKDVGYWLGFYLTKYVTKNDIVFNRLPWHCSRDVSALFTTIFIADEDFHLYEKHLSDEFENYMIINNDYATIYVFVKPINEYLYSPIDKINECVYSYFNPN